MTAPAPRWISEADVVQLMHLGEAIDALGRGLIEEAAGSARNMEKTAAHWGASSNMHAIGAVFEGAGVFGTKTWGNTPAGSTPLLLLWNATTAKLLAIIEARALGQMRTAAMSGIATRWDSAGTTARPSTGATRSSGAGAGSRRGGCARSASGPATAS